LLVIAASVAVVAAQLATDQVFEKAAPCVALVLVGRSPAELDGIGSAMVARENGVLLTAYHVVKDAQAVQIRFKNGEIFDEVQLLGIDRRRDIAAIRINASGLPVLPVAPAGQAKPGDSVCLVSHAAALPWTFSAGTLSAYRMADEVPGAGSGYRLLQFTAPTSPGSSGGVLVDSRGRALGLVVGTLEGGQNLNFAVPVESVLGLSDAPVSLSFGSGAQLQLQSQRERPVVEPPVAGSAAGSARAAQPRAEQDANADDLVRSELLVSKDKSFILSNFRTMYIDANKAEFFGADQMEAALGGNTEFGKLNVMIVDDRSRADVVLEIGYTFAWDYPFSLKHQNTSIVLVSGKGEGPFSGPAGAASVAGELAKLLKPYRSPKPQAR
jgi:S1-C subfamily serine protease